MKKKTGWKLAAFAVLLVGILITTVKMTTTATEIIPARIVSVDYVNETITVTTNDKIVYYTENYSKDVSKWDACEVRNGVAAFDISWINSKKTVRLYLCGDTNTEVISVDITWEENFGVAFTGTLLATDVTEASEWKDAYKPYTNFSEETGYLLFTVEENGRDMSYFNLENIYWRKGDDGVWRKFEELDLREMNIRGIKLEFQIVADNAGQARASSVASISISKLTSEPKLIVNSDTMTVGLKNGMEFSFDKETWFMIPEYNKKFGTEVTFITETERETAIEEIYTNLRITDVLMQDLIKQQVPDFAMHTPMDKTSLETACANQNMTFDTDGLVLYVREAGTEKKAASKVAELYIPYAADGKSIAVVDAVKFSYGDSKTNTGGIEVENTTTADKYQVGVITPDDENYAKVKAYIDAGTAAKDYDLDLSSIKWTSIKAGKMLKIANKKVPKDSYLVYRIAGDEGQLPSSYLIYGPMKYDHLTYAGIATAKKMVGETLEAVVSTNFDLKTDTTLTFQWQRCSDLTAEEVDWSDISGATGNTYEVTEDDINEYIRVMITDQYNNVKYRDEVGPIKKN